MLKEMDEQFEDIERRFDAIDLKLNRLERLIRQLLEQPSYTGENTNDTREYSTE